MYETKLQMYAKIVEKRNLFEKQHVNNKNVRSNVNNVTNLHAHDTFLTATANENESVRCIKKKF